MSIQKKADRCGGCDYGIPPRKSCSVEDKYGRCGLPLCDNCDYCSEHYPKSPQNSMDAPHVAHLILEARKTGFSVTSDDLFAQSMFSVDDLTLRTLADLPEYKWDVGSSWELKTEADGKKKIVRKTVHPSAKTLAPSRYSEGKLLKSLAGLFPVDVVVHEVLGPDRYKVRDIASGLLLEVAMNDLVDPDESM